MDNKLKQFLDDAFKPYGNFPARKDVQQELLANLTEKYNDLKAEGHTDNEAYQMTVDSFGDVSEIMEHIAHDQPQQQEKRGLKHTLITAIKHPINGDPDTSKFRATALEDVDLADTDLRGADFSMSALMKSKFDGANLQDAKFKATALKGASFAGADLSDANFDSSDLTEADLSGANLSSTVFRRCAFKKADFSNATLDNAEFNQSDLSEIVFDGLTLNGTVFRASSTRRATFKNTTLINVSFHHCEVKHTIFDGAIMDKVTYALLKGAKANLDNVTVQ